MNNLDNQQDSFFCLDIGTRSIMGIVATLIDEKLTILHSVTEFHRDRVMLDGQIHDIEGVTKIAKIVKNRLEDELGYELKEVSIAAAGRTLKTIRTNCSIDLDPDTLIDKHIIKSLEIEAIQKARKILLEQNEENHNYYNVGHSVINYMLDNSMIINPMGHKGSNLFIEIITTFLPQIVVDGLYSVMQNIGLDVGFMTLEPIAAIEAAVSNNVRLLNIALVDIGAGTSDIAITKDGTIIAYAMTSTAGDEITEALAQHYLLDFDTAEQVKCNLCKQEQQIFQDIVGIEHKISSDDILNIIEPSIENVAAEIAENIVKQNGKSPSAVFLIGGASQIPRLNNILASKLELPNERVAIKTTESIPNLITNGKMDHCPEGVTPIGILLCTSKNKLNDFIEVRVNDIKVKLFRSKKLKVSDAIILGGFNPNDLISRKGKSLRIILNDDEKLINGEYGREASIFLNGQLANLESDITDGDTIIIDPAVQGKNAKIFLKSILKEDDIVFVKDESIKRIINVELNDEKPNNWDIELKENDRINYTYLYCIKDLFDYLSITIPNSVFINEKLSDSSSPLISGCKIDYELEHNIDYEDFDNINETDDYKDENMNLIDNNYNDEEKNIIENNNLYNKINYPDPNLYSSLKIKYNGGIIDIKPQKNDIAFIDIFDYIDFDRTKVNGKLVLLHNGKSAEFSDLLKSGDEVVIKWV